MFFFEPLTPCCTGVFTRTCLAWTHARLHAASSDPDNDEQLQATHATSELLKVSSMLWHLIEVVFFDNEDDVTACLMEWLSEHFHDGDASVPVPRSPPDMWAMLTRQVLQGQVWRVVLTRPGRTLIAGGTSCSRIARTCVRVPLSCSCRKLLARLRRFEHSQPALCRSHT